MWNYSNKKKRVRSISFLFTGFCRIIWEFKNKTKRSEVVNRQTSMNVDGFFPSCIRYIFYADRSEVNLKCPKHEMKCHTWCYCFCLLDVGCWSNGLTFCTIVFDLMAWHQVKNPLYACNVAIEHILYAICFAIHFFVVVAIWSSLFEFVSRREDKMPNDKIYKPYECALCNDK